MCEIYRESYKGLTIRLICEEDADTPRAWDNVGTMVCWHRHYRLGDEKPKLRPDDWVRNLIGADDNMDTADCWKLFHQRFAALPLYLLDHSGLSMSTSSFGCPWDSGQVGWIYCSLEKAAESQCLTREPRYTWDTRVSGGVTLRQRAVELMRSEVQTYDAFLKGEVVRYAVQSASGEVVESVGGFYSEDDDYAHAKREARDAADAWLERQRETEIATAPCYI